MHSACPYVYLHVCMFVCMSVRLLCFVNTTMDLIGGNGSIIEGEFTADTDVTVNIDLAVQINPMILLVGLVRLNLNQPMECLVDQSVLVLINLD